MMLLISILFTIVCPDAPLNELGYPADDSIEDICLDSTISENSGARIGFWSIASNPGVANSDDISQISLDMSYVARGIDSNPINNSLYDSGIDYSCCIFFESLGLEFSEHVFSRLEERNSNNICKRVWENFNKMPYPFTFLLVDRLIIGGMSTDGQTCSSRVYPEITDPFIVVSRNIDSDFIDVEAKIWLHEYGHLQGLSHIIYDYNNLMYSNIDGVSYTEPDESFLTMDCYQCDCLIKNNSNLFNNVEFNDLSNDEFDLCFDTDSDGNFVRADAGGFYELNSEQDDTTICNFHHTARKPSLFLMILLSFLIPLMLKCRFKL